MTPAKIEHSKLFLAYLVDLSDERFASFGGFNLPEYRARCASCWAGFSSQMSSSDNIGQYLAKSIAQLLDMFPAENRPYIRKCFISLKARDKKDVTTMAVSRASARVILALRDDYPWAAASDIIDVMLAALSENNFGALKAALHSVGEKRGRIGGKEAKR